MIIKRPATVVDPHPQATAFLGVATFVPIARWRDVIKASNLSRRVEGQLKQSSGVAAYSLAVDILRRHFWTCSIWSSGEEIESFARTDPHATAVERFKELAGEGAAFVRWTTASAVLDWDEAFRRLEQPVSSQQKLA